MLERGRRPLVILSIVLIRFSGASSGSCYLGCEAAIGDAGCGSIPPPDAHDDVTVAAATLAAQALARHITEGTSALREAAAKLAEQHATHVSAARDALSQLGSQSAPETTMALRKAVALLADQPAHFMQDIGETGAQLAERLAQAASTKPSAVLREGAAMLVRSASGSQDAMREALAQLSEKHASVVQTAAATAEQLRESATEAQTLLSEAASVVSGRLSGHGEALRDAVASVSVRVSDKQAQFMEAASDAASRLKLRVADGKATYQEAVTQMVERRSELIHLMGEHASDFRRELSQRQAQLSEAASHAASKLKSRAVGGQEAAAALLAEHELLLRQSAALITSLAEIQSSVSPSAGRVAAQLSELQQQLSNVPHTCLAAPPTTNSTLDSVGEEEVAKKAFALPHLLLLRSLLTDIRAAEVAAGFLLLVVLATVLSTLHALCRPSGVGPEEFGYKALVGRAAWWFLHRVALGCAFLLLSDFMEQHMGLRQYDAMGWPMWSTLLPLSSQLCFFIPAAASLNAAVARRTSHASRPVNFYSRLSREVHASLIGCFVSDWCLFPTDVIFFGHHVLGLGIIFGVWSMIMREAPTLCDKDSPPPRQESNSQLQDAAHSTTVNFWMVTGVSVATMEASSFFFNLYSVISFGTLLNLSLFAVFTYSNVLSLLCVLAQHPWGHGVKEIWRSSGKLAPLFERAQSMFPAVVPGFLVWKGTHTSMSYILKAFLIAILCLARHFQMWAYVGSEVHKAALTIVAISCVLLAFASVWCLRHFEVPGRLGEAAN
eukprot:TRINITY_DN24344_c0_g2_i1.p1 TRINITY_DN24344_c0_g2~~TRINITY_DN24344_c0_g2_i1.p1  ORF type:complete len:779 (-),score=125.98 TRINITY_DN24344_c0_g2_i1:232-2568(-)